jgi:hypothetical protein
MLPLTTCRCIVLAVNIQVITNRLLLSLPVEHSQRLTPHLSVVPMTPRRVLQKQDEPIREVYFPGGFSRTTLLSLAADDARPREAQ